MSEPLEDRFQNLHEFVTQARINLDRNNWDYLIGASETETTVARNRLALDALGFRPRVLCDVSEVDCSGSLFGKKLRIPVFMTGGTHQAWARALRNEKGERPKLEKYEAFEAGHRFQVGDIEVKPFTIPHDAADPVGYTFRAEGIKVGVATDLGYLPVSVRDHLRGRYARAR